MDVSVEKANLSSKYIEHYNSIEGALREESPDMINARRKKAIQNFSSRGVPTQKDENYKYTDLTPQFSSDFQFIHHYQPVEVDLNTLFRCDIPQLNTLMIFIFNGWYYNNNRAIESLPKGVILDSLDKIGRERPELLEKYATLSDDLNDPFAELNTAYAKDGYFLYVPANVKIEKPIQLVNLLQADGDSFVTQRNFILIESGAEAELILCDHTLNSNSYISNAVTEIFVEKNANLKYYALQNQHNKATSINSVTIHQEQDSNVTTLFTSLHGGVIRNNLKIILDGENANANLFGLLFSDRKQHADNSVQVIHASPNCTSNQIYKSVLDEESSGAFTGQINVKQDAQKTAAFQRNNNLLLTDSATMNTKPQLIIDADDVKCSHGATVGQIDREALFYLQTRGIPLDKAHLIMMNAFAYEVIEQITVEPLRDRISNLIDKRLKGEIARCHDCNYNC